MFQWLKPSIPNFSFMFLYRCLYEIFSGVKATFQYYFIFNANVFHHSTWQSSSSLKVIINRPILTSECSVVTHTARHTTTPKPPLMLQVARLKTCSLSAIFICEILCMHKTSSSIISMLPSRAKTNYFYCKQSYVITQTSNRQLWNTDPYLLCVVCFYSQTLLDLSIEYFPEHYLLLFGITYVKLFSSLIVEF